jgi:Tol biopolymer transport system component
MKRLAIGLVLLATTTAAGIASAATPPRHLVGTIAFTGEPSFGPAQIFLARPDGTVKQLTHAQFSLSALSWSPDGSRLLVFEFHPPADTEVDILKADGSWDARVSGHVDNGPRWSPDGTRIAFQRERSIYVVRADGSLHRTVHPERRLASNGAPVTLGGGLSWSPDGRRIAYVGTQKGRPALFVVAADGSTPATAIYVPRSGGAFYPGPEWSTDGAEIAFSAPGGIYAVKPDGTGLKLLRAGHYSGPAWSPRSVLIAFVGPHANYLMRRDGTHVRRLPGCVCTNVYPGFEQHLSWSSDASEIAYSGGIGPHADGGIYYVDIDGSGATRVAYSPDFAFYGPIWRPGGR